MNSKSETLLLQKTDHCPVRVVEPYPVTHRFKVRQEESGMTLSGLMSARFPFHSQAEWERRIMKGLVGLADSELTDVSYRIQEGDLLFHYNPAVKEPSVPDMVHVIADEADHLIAYKPAPMPVHPGGRYNRNTLIAILGDMNYRDLKIVHRLDAVTSGLVLFARNKETARKAMENFAGGRVEKTYYALVKGCPEKDEFVINTPVRRKKGFIFESGHGLKNAKEALTRFKVAERGDQNSIIACKPVTGRTHQIRLHLREAGYPIIDDEIYRNTEDPGNLPQRNAISLLNAGLNIPEMHIDASLPVPEAWYRKLDQA